MTNAWNRQQLGVVSCVLATAACATQIVPSEGDEVNVPGGVGGASAGTSATGGTLGAMTSGGATSGGGTNGGGTNGSGTGGDGATSGTGGVAGAATPVGSAGKGAAGGRSGTFAMGGRAAGTAGTGGASANGDGNATGCAKLSVPMNGANDKAHFVVSLRSAADLSAAGTTISMRVHVQDGVGGVILAYAQDSSFNFLGPATKPLLAEQDGWVTLTWDIGAEPAAQTGIMKRSISRLGIEIKAAPSATWSNPTVVYVDSISVNAPALSFPFGTTGTVSGMAQSSDVAGQVLWLNSGTMDTTATGTTLSWVATCP